MKVLEHLSAELEKAHLGDAWHGPSVSDALAGLDAAAASRRPLAAAHNIREIVHHLRVTDDLVRAHLTGAAAGQEDDWPAVAEIGEAAWQEELTKLAASQLALRQAVAALPEAALFSLIPGKELTYAAEIFGILHHDLYHAGQISLLRKAS